MNELELLRAENIRLRRRNAVLEKENSEYNRAEIRRIDKMLSEMDDMTLDFENMRVRISELKYEKEKLNEQRTSNG